MSKPPSKPTASCSSTILEYLMKSNRPYSANDIFSNLQKEHGHGKTAVVKALDELVQKEKLIGKVNGKQMVYFVDQSVLPVVNENELKAMDNEITQLTNTLKELNSSVREKESRLASLKNNMSLEEIDSEIGKVKKEIKELQSRLDSMGELVKTIDPNENEKVKEERMKVVGEWRKRKRMAHNIIDAVLDGYPKPKKVLMEEIEIDTDEMNKVVMPEL